jgi:hypothetical protein
VGLWPVRMVCFGRSAYRERRGAQATVACSPALRSAALFCSGLSQDAPPRPCLDSRVSPPNLLWSCLVGKKVWVRLL